MLKLIFAMVISCVLVLLMGPKVIDFLRRQHFGQTIYELGPESHMGKQGTPIMGGMMVAAAATVCLLIFHPAGWYGVWDFALALLSVSLLSMLVGFGDDFIKAIRQRHEGLTPWQKIAGQVIVAVGFSVYCYLHPMVGSAICIPFTSYTWDLGLFYIPLMSLVIIFMVNSSNLQDGVDGILSTVSAIGNTGWAAIALFLVTLAGSEDPQAHDSYLTAAIFALAVVGGTLGLLRFNRYPAKIFQGDSGSMFIGGVTVGLAMLLKQPLLMLLVNFTMVGSSLSVIIQRTYFKLTHGKRIFKMSPIHHHFEKSGYSETQIVSMYACVTALLTIISVLSVWQI